MKIQHNLSAMDANRNIKINTGIFAKTTEKLASGYKINRAADDAAGLSISEKLRRQIRGLTQASQNCQDGISMVQTADGALNEVHDMLQRMNQLAVQSANGTNTEADREALQEEFAQIQEEIDRVSQTTTFNEMRLFAEGDGSTTNGTNNGNTPSVTSLDDTGQTPAVMSMRSMARAAGVTCGAFTVSGGTEGVDFSYADRTLTVLTGTNLTIEGTGAPTTDKIEIKDGIVANVTLKNVNIDVSNEGLNPIKVAGTATLNLTLMEENTLKAGTACAGVNVENGAKLVITEQSTGSLSSTGGESGAGIGSNSWGRSGDITIAGGTITATGIRGAAGIGGGYQSVGGTIDIVGGTVTAESTGEGAGIGGGNGASGGNITISGGTVTAKSNTGSGIGDGQGGTGGTFSTGTNGNANITATGGNGADAISDTSNQADWSGNINGVTYPIRDFTVTGGTSGTDYSYDSTTGTLTILSDKDITIEGTGAATTDKIVIKDGITANVTLKDVNIDVSSTYGACAFDVDGNATLNLTLEGENTLKSGGSKAGLQVESGATLNIMGGSGDKLNATGGISGAGIGGGSSGAGGTITLNGGEVTSTGGAWGSGIGGGDRGAGGDITINGGEVTATAGGSGAGIGGGNWGAGGDITISGGEVTATGGNGIYGAGGAGIGGGFEGAGGDITISGGNVTATGGGDADSRVYAVGIGAGLKGAGGTFSTGTNGSATINVSRGDGSQDLSDLISDSADTSNWSGTINGVQYGAQTPPAAGTGDFTVTGGTIGTDYSYDSTTGTLTILSNKDITIEGTGAATTDKIVIKDGITANVTLKDVNIDVSSTNNACALDVDGTASLNLTLTGTNTLKSGINCAGLQVTDGASLVIIEQSTGALTVTGGRWGAGIGGGVDEDGGNINIAGGVVQAAGGINGPGIGGGGRGNGGYITISGGEVTAIGSTNAAGIGGGVYGDGGNVIISSGKVQATGGTNGDGIGGGDGGADGTFSTGTNGNAEIKAEGGINGTAIADVSNQANWSGTINGVTYPIAAPPAAGTGDFTVTGGTIGTDYSYDDTTGTLTILSDKDITIKGTGATTTDKIVIKDGITANVTLKDVNIDVSSTDGASALDVDGNATLNLTLEGNITLKSGSGKAGLQVQEGATLNIMGGSGDKLNATGGYGGAGGTITIKGGDVTANGGIDAAGIGGGYDGAGGDITISGGDVTANGGNAGAGIGGGDSGDAGTFSTGTNGSATITATGGIDISDTSGQANWSGKINGVTYPLGTIDLSTLTGPLEITDSGYKVGSQEYNYTGDYTFTGSTTQDIIVSGGGTTNIKLNAVTGNNITVTNNSTVNLTLNGSSSMNDVTVENGSTLNTKGSGTLKITNSLDNDGTLNNDAVIENAGTMDNSGTIANAGTMNNSGTITNDGTLKNDGTVNNNTGGTIDTTNGTFDNSNGTIKDKGGTSSGTITGNQPVAGGSGGAGGNAGTGSAKNSWWIQAGAESGVGINIEIGAMNTEVLGIQKDTVNISTQDSAGDAITAVSGAIEKLSTQRSRLGAYQNRLEHTIRNLDNVVENTTAAESRIRDADMANLMVKHSNNNIIMQAAQAMLTQANHQPEGILQLLQ